MTFWMLALTGPDGSPIPSPDLGAGIRGLVAVGVVLALVALFAWLLKRGAFGPLGRKGTSGIRVETAVPLGDRRSLAIVAVEGRRLLVGLAPGQISLITELRGGDPAFAGTLDRAVDVDSRGAA